VKLEEYIAAKRRLKSHLTTNLHLQLLVVTDYTFLQFFQQYGEVVDSIVLLDRRTKRSRGFGFVTFADEVSSYHPILCPLFASNVYQSSNLTSLYHPRVLQTDY